jgi:hypothetical protein
MHLHFPFSTVEVLWTLTFAAQLVLLVVLLGRERIRRFPWFTVGIIAVALRALTARLLFHRMAPLTYAAILLTLADLGVAIGLVVLVELTRKAFLRARRSTRAIWLAVLAAVGAVVLRYWGQWPSWSTLTANSQRSTLMMMQLAAQKGELLLSVLTVELGILIVLFGRRYGAGWRSHTQRIMIGLSTTALGQLSAAAILQIIAAHAIPKTRAEYEHLIGIGDKISNANNALYLVVLVWWIASLWKDEPGAAKPVDESATAKPATAPGTEPADEAAIEGQPSNPAVSRVDDDPPAVGLAD